MFWVLQENLFNEQSFKDLLEQLERQDTDYEIVKLIPFIHEMEPDINPTGPVFVNGSTGIGKVARKKGWVPGYFDKRLDYVSLMGALGKECLNHRAFVTTLRNAYEDLCTANGNWDWFFVRPVMDNKSFNGQTMSRYDFEEWRIKVLALEEGENSLTTLKPDDQIVIAPRISIYSETRFFVVDGEIVTGSMYKLGNKVYYTNKVDPACLEYAEEMMKLWQPDRAFVLDIAEIPNEPQFEFAVIETNSINSSGFYAADMGKYVNAINSMRFPEYQT